MEQIKQETTFKQSAFYNTYIAPAIPKDHKELAWTIIIIGSIVAIGLFAFNQFLGMQYKIQLLQNACEICESYGNSCYANMMNINLSDLIISP